MVSDQDARRLVARANAAQALYRQVVDGRQTPEQVLAIIGKHLVPDEAGTAASSSTADASGAAPPTPPACPSFIPFRVLRIQLLIEQAAAEALAGGDSAEGRRRCLAALGTALQAATAEVQRAAPSLLLLSLAANMFKLLSGCSGPAIDACLAAWRDLEGLMASEELTTALLLQGLPPMMEAATAGSDSDLFWGLVPALAGDLSSALKPTLQASRGWLRRGLQRQLEAAFPPVPEEAAAAKIKRHLLRRMRKDRSLVPLLGKCRVPAAEALEQMLPQLDPCISEALCLLLEAGGPLPPLAFLPPPSGAAGGSQPSPLVLSEEQFGAAFVEAVLDPGQWEALVSSYLGSGDEPGSLLQQLRQSGLELGPPQELVGMHLQHGSLPGPTHLATELFEEDAQLAASLHSLLLGPEGPLAQVLEHGSCPAAALSALAEVHATLLKPPGQLMHLGLLLYAACSATSVFAGGLGREAAEDPADSILKSLLSGETLVLAATAAQGPLPGLAADVEACLQAASNRGPSELLLVVLGMRQPVPMGSRETALRVAMQTRVEGIGSLRLAVLVPLCATCCWLVKETFADVADLGGRTQAAVAAAEVALELSGGSFELGPKSLDALLHPEQGRPRGMRHGKQGLCRRCVASSNSPASLRDVAEALAQAPAGRPFAASAFQQPRCESDEGGAASLLQDCRCAALLHCAATEALELTVQALMWADQNLPLIDAPKHIDSQASPHSRE
ncbi:hypothetical protein ABPG75_000261 [Micractinium tetrahymenae]